MERIIGDAVRNLLASRQAADAAAATRVPLRLQGPQDVPTLLEWLKKLCANEGLRERFLSGQLQLDIQLGLQSPARLADRVAAGAEAIAPVEAERRRVAMNENVVTEALLRRHAQRNDVIALPARAVVTPSAWDYARAAGIRMERKS